MLRMLLVLLALLVFSSTRSFAQDAPPAAEPAAEADQAGAPGAAEQPPVKEPSPEAVAAKEGFDALLAQWQEKVTQIQNLQEERASAPGTERKQLDEQIAKLGDEASPLVEQLVDAGVEVYRADPQAYPRINSTVLAIAQFYLLGDANGDGGDQYEKAYELSKKLIDAGAGKDWKELYVWGGVAAFHVNQFADAEAYFAKARELEALGAAPPNRNPRDPRTRLWETAQNNLRELPALKKAWEAESAIRAQEAEANDLPRVKFTTNRGDVVMELFENEAPEAVANIITLVKKGYYDGVTFHRVLPGFMAQGGDPEGTGRGGPGYNIRSEFNKPGARKHFRGSLSMANTGQPNTGGSQFFLTFVPTSMLDGKHTVFGRVIEGMDVAASLKRRNPELANPGKADKIIKAEVLRDRGHDYKFEKLPER